MKNTPDTVIAIDPHKGSWVAVVVDAKHQVLAEASVATNRDGYRELKRVARSWPGSTWAIEGVNGLGRPLAERLRQDGIDVIDVSAKQTSRVRQLATGHGRKTDRVDAFSVAVVALSREHPHHQWDDQSQNLRLLTDFRTDLIKRRTQVVNRLHVLLMDLVAGGAPRSLTANRAAELIRRVRPRSGLAATRRSLAASLIREIRHLDGQIKAVDAKISDAVAESQTSLLEINGIGPVLAARIIGRVGPCTRFPTAGHFASYCGTAPLDVSSGDSVRHRLSRSGDRQLNHALHLVALSQIRHNHQGRAYYERKRASGKSHREAMRCLKRRLATVVFKALTHDHHQTRTPTT